MAGLAENWAPRMLSILRIVTALLFIQHGAQKLLGFPSAPANGLPEMLTLPWWQGIIELVGGALLLLGLFTRLTAFILAGDMAVAYWWIHAPRNYYYPILNGGDLAILFCFIFLYIACAGPGPWSLDGSVRRKS